MISVPSGFFVVLFQRLPDRAGKAQETYFHIPVKMQMSYIIPSLLRQSLT